MHSETCAYGYQCKSKHYNAGICSAHRLKSCIAALPPSHSISHERWKSWIRFASNPDKNFSYLVTSYYTWLPRPQWKAAMDFLNNFCLCYPRNSIRRTCISSFTCFVEDCTRWRRSLCFAGWGMDPSQSTLLFNFFHISRLLKRLVLFSRWVLVSLQIKVTCFHLKK